MEEIENQTVQKKGIRTELIIAISAIVISLATLCVYIYQARIMIHQAELMQSQQHFSVWPHVESSTSVSSKNGVPVEAFLEVENKGIGPAIVKKIEVRLNGKIIKNNQLVPTLLGTDTLNVSTSAVENRVIAPGEKIRAFYLTDSQLILKLATIIQKQKFEYIICYCSVYDDCWTSNGTKVVAGKCE